MTIRLQEPNKSRTPKIPLNYLIAVAAFVMLCDAFFCVSTAISGASSTPTPTIDLVAIQSTAIAQAWLSYTQTAAAVPTSTPLPTDTQIPTNTNIPTSTLILTNTVASTVVVPIYPTSIPNYSPLPTQSSSGYCCKYCGNTSQPCGDSCISLKYTCHKPPGCACK